MLRIVFMGTPEFAVPALKAISSFPGCTIAGVYTQPDRPVGRGLELRASPVKQLAVSLGYPVLQPEKLSAPGEFERLQALRPDLIVVVAFGQILRQNVLDLPRLGCVNIHSSLLPRWRGAAPIQRALLAGDPETGVTTMRLVLKLDAGDILLQSKTPIRADDTAQTLHDRLAELGAALIARTLTGLAEGTLQGRAQDESQVTYAAKLEKEEEWLNPAEPAAILDRKVRALNPWPGTSVMVSVGQSAPLRLKIKKARLWPDLTVAAGKIQERNGMVLLGTPEGSLELQSLQWDGKKAVDAGGFLNGLRGQGHGLPLDCAPRN